MSDSRGHRSWTTIAIVVAVAWMCFALHLQMAAAFGPSPVLDAGKNIACWHPPGVAWILSVQTCQGCT